jgi:SAM-dependent methyltransferase
MAPTYGVSERYQGPRGEDYFARQNADIAVANGGPLSARPFLPFVSTTADVLDFGCGGGWLLKNLPTSGKRIGVEPNLHAHAQCRANGVNVYDALPEVPGTFDVVISNHCLEHVPFPIAALREVRQKMKPNGRLVLVLPLDDWRARRQRAFSLDDRDNHLHTWTPRLIGNTLEEAGFTPIEVRIMTHAWPPRYAAQLFSKLPLVVFDWVCYLTAVALKRHQILAVARVS